jgi:hypothetical protein
MWNIFATLSLERLEERNSLGDQDKDVNIISCGCYRGYRLCGCSNIKSRWMLTGSNYFGIRFSVNFRFRQRPKFAWQFDWFLNSKHYWLGCTFQGCLKSLFNLRADKHNSEVYNNLQSHSLYTSYPEEWSKKLPRNAVTTQQPSRLRISKHLHFENFNCGAVMTSPITSTQNLMLIYITPCTASVDKAEGTSGVGIFRVSFPAQGLLFNCPDLGVVAFEHGVWQMAVIFSESQ